MRPISQMLSVAALLLVLFFASLGFFFILLQESAALRLWLYRILFSNLSQLKGIGWFFLSVAFLLLFSAFLNRTKSRLTLRLDVNSWDVEQRMIRAAVDRFFKYHFPHIAPPTELLLNRRGQIELHFKGKEEELKFHNLVEIEEHLSAFLKKTIGYEKPFFIHVTRR